MIYTVTFNPALDYAAYVDDFHSGATNRTTHETLSCGGKGINVSIILGRLGVLNVALGFLAGFTGQMIAAWLTELGVTHDFITLSHGMSRINIKLKTEVETEINGQGPHIPRDAVAALEGKLDALSPGDTLILSGSIPASLPDDIYQHLLSRLEGKGVATLVDATGPLLEKVLPYGPFLVKPNHEELAALCGVTLAADDLDGIARCARQLQAKGGRNVLVSMAGAGCLLVTEDGQRLVQPAAQGSVVNSVGAGDSMVAGFLAGWQQTGDYRHALKLGTAAGGATAFSPNLATAKEISCLFQNL